MSKKKVIILFVLVFLFGIGVNKLIFTHKKEDLSTEKSIQKKNTRALSMMLETGAGTGVYETTTRSTWPTDGYLFNEELSKCENGGKLSWNDENNTVVMTGSTSDKCYVYFDVYVPPKLTEWVIEQYAGVQGQNGIYLHNSSLTNSANDGSYRYSGANPNNYVCFGTTQSPCPSEYLYRIVGVFGESSHGVIGSSLVKLMMNNYATSEMLGINGMYSSGNLYSFSDEEMHAEWSTSELNTINLNTNYIGYLGTTYSNLIVTARFVDNNKKLG